MQTIKRDIYVTKNVLQAPIEVTEGTNSIAIEFDVRDYDIPASAAAVAYSLSTSSMEEPNKALADVSGNKITIIPSEAFFLPGQNVMQVRIIDGNSKLISFNIIVKCTGKMRFGDEKEEQQSTLVEQMLAKLGEYQKKSASPYNFKGSCLSSALPASGNTINDTYYCTDLKYRKTWNGSAWEQSSLNEADYEDELTKTNGEVSSLKEDIDRLSFIDDFILENQEYSFNEVLSKTSSTNLSYTSPSRIFALDKNFESGIYSFDVDTNEQLTIYAFSKISNSELSLIFKKTISPYKGKVELKNINIDSNWIIGFCGVIGYNNSSTEYRIKLLNVTESDGNYTYTDGAISIITTIKVSKLKKTFSNPIYFSVLGDSISAFENFVPPNMYPYYPQGDVKTINDMWWHLLTLNTRYQRLYVNASSGSFITMTKDSMNGSGNGERGFCNTRCENLSKGDINPQIIIIEGGANDFKYPVNLGTYNGSETTFPTDTTKFREAYCIMLKKIREKYKEAFIFCCTIMPQNRSTNTNFPPRNNDNVILNEFNKAIKELSDLFGCYVIDLDKCGITFQNLNITTLDGTLHPNALGQKLMYNCIKNSLDSVIN